ncbi:MAG: nickel-dependent lactate racemase [bacterium]
MPIFSLAYGEQSFQFELESKNVLGVLKPNRPSPAGSPVQLINQALDFPIASQRFEKVFQKGGKTVIIVPDKTRKAGAEIYLPILVRRLNALGIRDRDIEVVLATGSHAPESPAEIEGVVGSEIYHRFEIIEHDCHDSENLVYLGETKNEVPVYISKHAVEAEQLLVTGTTVHHYFAGYGGGAKMINPGCAGYETVTRNHALTIDEQTGEIHANCRAGRSAGNPVLEDIHDSMKYMKPAFLLSTVIDEQGTVVEAVAGDLLVVHKKSCEIVDAIYKVAIAQKADLVVVSCGGLPKDVNFIQAHKSLQNAFVAVKPGGTIILLAECRDGIGSQTFLDWFDYPDDAALSQAIRKHYKVNGTTALSLKNKTRAAHVILVSTLETGLVLKLGMRPASDVGQAFKMAMRQVPTDFKCYVIPNGSLTLPHFEGNRA